MKKLLFLLITLLVMIPTIASAHTELTSPTPAANQVVKEDLKTIVLTYEGKIESLSTMDLIKDGQKIFFVSVTPKDNQMIGTLSAPLENGSYTIQWSIAGAHGHPIKGEIPSKVQKEVKAEQRLKQSNQYGQMLLLKHISIIPVLIFAFINGVLSRKSIKLPSFNPRP
ncbi:copper resistance protein CopC [Bacillus salipaludis]|uniref:Copper resistance protein CopC n=1 Tax=Bacillus salipaludis TaxID=2547811 RepID=A0A4R5VZR3_9BACI|nr:copper resistance CopC family protein [Bacillus salipaludis]MDQ6596378.1 copper resistance protein CopC [Bacillus salipaludis]TDK65141.1 copper resistance protein CopC [Bacillus salipaludis]